VGGVIGGVVFIIIILTVVILVRRKKRRPKETMEKGWLKQSSQTTELNGYCLPGELDGKQTRNELSGSSRYVFELHG
jgi:hypothetical protein